MHKHLSSKFLAVPVLGLLQEDAAGIVALSCSSGAEAMWLCTKITCLEGHLDVGSKPISSINSIRTLGIHAANLFTRPPGPPRRF